MVGRETKKPTPMWSGFLYRRGRERTSINPPAPQCFQRSQSTPLLVGEVTGEMPPPIFIQTSLSNPCPTLLAGLSGQRYGDPTFGSTPIVIHINKYAQDGPGRPIRQFLGRVMQTGLAGTGIPRPPLPFTSNIWGGHLPLPPSLHLSPHRGCAVTFSRSETGVLIKPFPRNDRHFSYFFVVRL
jgi:hypothetical protein